MLRIAICDDNELLCQELVEMIEDYVDKNRINAQIESFNDGADLNEFLKAGNPLDLIFLDIEMTKMNGIQLSKEIRMEMKNHQVNIVYITATDGYDRKLFEFQPLYFISKPIRVEKVFHAINLMIEQSTMKHEVFQFEYNGWRNGVALSEILYFKREKRIIRIITGKQEFKFYGKLDEVIKELPAERFIQIHRSYVINMDRVITSTHEAVTMADQMKILVSKNRRKAFRVSKHQRRKERAYATGSI